jgi:hypothetical protein
MVGEYHSSGRGVTLFHFTSIRLSYERDPSRPCGQERIAVLVPPSNQGSSHALRRPYKFTFPCNLGTSEYVSTNWCCVRELPSPSAFCQGMTQDTRFGRIKIP